MPSFKTIGLLVLEKNILKVFAIYSHGGHFGRVTLTIHMNMNFHSPFLRMLHTKFGFDWASGIDKIFEYYYYHVYCSGVGADLPRWGQTCPWGPFIFRIIKLFPSKDILTNFPIQMHGRPMLTMPQDRSRSSQGHDLYTQRKKFSQ